MKILHINCADTGSTGKIINDISRVAFSEGHKSFLLCPQITNEKEYLEKKQVCITHETGVYKRASAVMGLRYGFAPVSTARIISEIKKISPSVVHIHSANCHMVNLYRLFSFLKKNNIPTVITNHAEFFYTGTCPHAEECEKWKTGCGDCPDIRERASSLFLDRTHTAWMKMKRSFSGFTNMRMVSVSPWVDERARLSPITEGIEKRVILNGLDTEAFSYKKSDLLRERFSIGKDEKIVLCVTAGFDPDNEKDIKGSADLVDIAENFSEEKVKFVVVGQTFPYKRQLPRNMIIAGLVNDSAELSSYYSEADLSLITSKRETFSMIVAESLCCGTPVVGFEAGGPESICMKEFCRFFPQGDKEGIEKGIREMLTFKNTYDVKALSEKAAVIYSGEEMAKKYLDLYKELI